MATRFKRRDIAFEGKDWKNRTVTLLRDTIKRHIALYHIEELFVVNALQSKLSSPIAVVWNPGAKSEQAVYEIPCNGHPYLQVIIKEKGWPKKALIVTFYGVDAIPKGKKLWPVQ
ncbi:MAG TPA: hypothetical protein VFQ00_10785 [Terriglobales bacterium]|nr:hypothetical protein [Terriglobales bacterium]